MPFFFLFRLSFIDSLFPSCSKLKKLVFRQWSMWIHAPHQYSINLYLGQWIMVIYQRLDSHNGWLIRSSLQLLAELFLAYVRSTVNVSCILFQTVVIAMHPRFKRCDFKHDFDQNSCWPTMTNVSLCQPFSLRESSPLVNILVHAYSHYWCTSLVPIEQVCFPYTTTNFFTFS